MKWNRGHTSPASGSWASADGFVQSRWEHLDNAERLRLSGIAHALEERWSWEGLDGFDVTEEARAHVATIAALLVLEPGPQLLSDVTSVLIAHTSSQSPTRSRLGDGLVAEGHGCVLGSALLHGPVKLAWDRVVEEQSPDSTTSVVIHEFAHKIDMADGDPSGAPPIADRVQARAFESAAEDTLDTVRSRGSEVLRPYAGTNRSELFAVATEAFFLHPGDLETAHPALFVAMRSFYRQTPARTSRTA
jgi:Mlc titration factor MtfA (ptsG expression regulator)